MADAGHQVWVSMRPLLALPTLMLGVGFCGGAIFTRCKCVGRGGARAALREAFELDMASQTDQLDNARNGTFA